MAHAVGSKSPPAVPFEDENSLLHFVRIFGRIRNYCDILAPLYK